MHQYPSPTTIFVVSALEIEISCHDVSVSPNLVRVCFVVCATVRMMLERRNGFMIKDTCLCLMHLTFLYIYFFFSKISGGPSSGYHGCCTVGLVVEFVLTQIRFDC